ncbi:MAG: hypothetical protein ABGY32_15185, partial [bacterium]
MSFPLKHISRPAFLAAVAPSLALLSLAPEARADLTFGDFNSSSGLSLVGSASTVAGRLRLNASGTGT